MASSFLYQLSPRFGHCTAQVGEKAFLWGGRTQSFYVRGRITLASELNIFDAFTETWNMRGTTGVPPPGLYDGGCTVIDNSLYYFGGRDGYSYYNSLHCINTITAEWKELSSQNSVNQPMPKAGFGIVSYTDTTSFAVFAGYGIPRRLTQAGANFVQITSYTDGSGCTNELHLFNLTNGEWSSPPTTGPRPPPCAYFSFTAVNHHMAVMFGGYYCGRGWVNDVYIIDFRSMKWTKLKSPEGAPLPMERTDHAACCLNFGDDHPQLLVTGGLDKSLKTLSDAWLLDIYSGMWREVSGEVPVELTLPEGTQPRWGHTIIAFSVCPGRTHTTTFGGSPKYEYHLGKLDDDHQKLAETTVMEFGRPWSMELRYSEALSEHTASMKYAVKLICFESVESGQWVIVGIIGSSGLGTPERLTKLEILKQRKTDRGFQFQPPVAVDPIPDPLMISGFPTQPLAMQPTLLHSFPFYKPKFQYHLAETPVQQTRPTQYSSDQEMYPKQLPSIPLIQQSIPPYYAPSLLPTIFPSEVQPISSTAAYQVEASTAAAPFDQPSTLSGSLDTLWTTVSTSSRHTTCTDMPLQESPLPRRASQTADIKPKVKQPSPKEKKPSLLDIKFKMDMSPKKELEGFKMEPKEEVEEDVKFKQVFSVRDVDKDDLVEQLAAKNELLHDIISQLKEQIAEKVEKIDEKDRQIAEKSWQVVKQAEQIAEKDQQTAQQAEQISELAQKTTEKDEQIVKYQQMYGHLQESQVHRKLPPPTDTHDEFPMAKSEFHPSNLRTNSSDAWKNDNVTTTEYLRGFETFAATSFAVNDSRSHSFEWQRYGLKLHIPEGAVPVELRECRVDIKAGFIGQFNIPDDLQLVSCVYWLSCPQKFVKPVTLEIEHCASLQDSSQSSSLQFVVAKCSQEELPYQFRALKKGMFAPRSSYGSIQVNQFSFFGIGIFKRFWSLQRYYCTLYYIEKDINKWHVDFVIVLYLQVSLKAIQDRYASLDAISGPDFEVRFKNDMVILAVPEDGICLANGWAITPLVPPVIEKQQVDEFKPGQRVPYCRLEVTFDNDRKPVELKHKVKLLGTMSPHDFFTITCSPEEYVDKPDRVTARKRRQLEDSGKHRVVKKRRLSNEYVDKPPTASGKRKQLQEQEQEQGASSTLIPSPVAADVGLLSPNIGTTTHSNRGRETERTSSKPEIKDLIDALYHKVADKWKIIGLYLEIPKGKLASISKKCRDDPHSCLVEMLQTWLERVNPPVTWTAIIEAIEFLGEEQLGEELRDMYTDAVN